MFLVLVDEPQGANTYGSTVAAPVAKFVIDALISLKGIPPSK
ncbi:penicillin-binding protein [Crocosphaera watsonii WH 8501]|uniref:Penicillin-binding protein n=1 Tax=Crocosphaera watsonii WH 8501 TaxID=165597 RepID=Q4BUW8_CROWT|nr:penicillin-binding protein [Crocosphaera watsonii WH 8501]